ncbi:MAG: nucleoside hydrolase [Dehalococcoidia bacterium]|nr:nucleoside hydrolase [Dehalococcoidia bacterium]
MATEPVIIDCDPGQDDAVALLLALASPGDLNVLAVTAVSGNVPLELTAANARRVIELAGRSDVPVHAGCDRPLLRPAVTAEHMHGQTGLDGAGLPDTATALADGHAVEAIIELLRERPSGSVTLCPVGPLTNVALALHLAPDIADRIGRIVLMGGAAGPGNVTPSAEFNIYVDPHAASIVFRSGAPIVMLGLDVTQQALVNADRLAAIAAVDTPVSRSVVGMLDFYGARSRVNPSAGSPLHDPCAVAYLLDPGLFAGRPCHVMIEVEGTHTLGRTVVDRSGRADTHPNATVIDEVDAGGLFALLTERLARLTA